MEGDVPQHLPACGPPTFPIGSRDQRHGKCKHPGNGTADMQCLFSTALCRLLERLTACRSPWHDQYTAALSGVPRGVLREKSTAGRCRRSYSSLRRAGGRQCWGRASGTRTMHTPRDGHKEPSRSRPEARLTPVPCHSSMKHKPCCAHNIWRAGEGLRRQLEQEGQDRVEEALPHHQEQEPVHQRRQSRGGRVVGDGAASHLLHHALQREVTQISALKGSRHVEISQECGVVVAEHPSLLSSELLESGSLCFIDGRS